jgi:hypothetical protein
VRPTSDTHARQDAGGGGPRHHPDPTVPDQRGKRRAGMSAAELGGDVGGTDQVPMPLEPAVRTGEPAPAWLGTRWRQAGQVEDVPRSSSMLTRIPACSALSRSAPSRWVRRRCRSRQFCTRPASRSVMPVGSPTTKVPTRWAIAKAMTWRAAWWWAWWTRRRWRASARRWPAPADLQQARRCRGSTGSGPGSVCDGGTRPAPHGGVGGRPRTRHRSTATAPSGPRPPTAPRSRLCW